MNRRLTIVLLLGLATCGLLAPTAPAAATAVYACTGADGRTVFQDKPCRRDQHQRVLDLPDAPVASPPPAAAATPAAPAAPEAPQVPPAPAPPTAPLPVLYTCVRATDGTTYLSGNGAPPPYQAPYGVLGAEQLPLSEVYGPDRGGAGISAPEANRGRVTSGMVADNYVWVQDSCRELGIEETCRALRDAYDENERKLRNAFRSQRPPLERREAQLQAQLASCGS
ncbi:DUF4124 domain-containing protein [Fulvimonas yonginensis]|uniref:DUF4124 domain-containing protein n=1 Tax=Fulvimonas yonginensis TaxID=1495200 RepID=A0ABU8J8I3_9GAMM